MNLRITDLLDDYMDEKLYLDPVPVPDTKRIKEAAMKKIKKQRNVRPLRIALIAAAVVLLLTGTVLAVMHYTRITDSMEEKWNEQASTEMTSEHKDFIEQRSASIGESVTDQGITVTIDSVTCTADAVNILYSVALDPVMYDLDSVENSADALSVKWVENEDYGTMRSSGGGGSGMLEEDGVVWREMRVEFNDLPEGANLGDGKTTMHIKMNTFWMHSEEGKLPDVMGTWNFAFLLPQSEAAEAKTSDAVLNFDGGITLEISGINVTESGCGFTVVTDNNEYIFANNGEEAMMAAAAMPDAPIYTVEVKLADGTQVPSDGASMSHDETNGDQWKISWASPLEPSNVVSLIFSDGTTEIEVPLDE